MNLTEKQKENLHEFYETLREMSKSDFPRRGLQRSFEEMIYSVMGKNAWTPTHITKAALCDYVSGKNLKIQRAHGAFEDRMDRYERTLKILEGDSLSFDEWWSFFTYHDKTILMTRKEHGSGNKPSLESLVKIPNDEGMFETSGFSARIRKKVEVVWMRAMCEKFNLLSNSGEYINHD